MAENENTPNPNPNPNPPTNGGDKGDSVVLTADQYKLIYDAVEKLEKENESLKQAIVGKGGKGDIDDLADEGRRSKTPEGDKTQLPDFDKMSNRDLAMFIGETIHSKMISPLITEIQALRMENQIKELINDPDKDAKDFYDYKKEIFDIMSKTPNLSVEDAYFLAKRGKGGAKSKDDDKDERKGILTVLPKRPFGEKPGAPSGGTTPEANTRIDAAKMALEKMQKEGLLPKG